jgi:DNA replication ATP-dependent helicase Dna2
MSNLNLVEEYIAPLEIKTGRAVGVMAHRAQTMLYTLLMEDRYSVPVPAGLLYYSQLDSILRVEARPNEIRALIMARNEIAAWMMKKREVSDDFELIRRGSSEQRVPSKETQQQDIEDATFLPPTIDHARECRSCYAVDSCMLYRKVGLVLRTSTRVSLG